MMRRRSSCWCSTLSVTEAGAAATAGVVLIAGALGADRGAVFEAAMRALGMGLG